MKKGLIVLNISFLLLAILVSLPQFSFLVTLAKSLAFHLGIGLVLLAVLLFVFKKRWTGVIGLVIASVCFFQTNFWEWYQENDLSSEDSDLVITHFNVLKFNTEHQELLADIQVEIADCDIVSFQETDSLWTKDIVESLKDSFPYFVTHPRNDCYGLLFASKYPIAHHEIKFIQNIPHIEAVLEIDKEQVPMIFMHTRAPMNGQKHQLRNEQLTYLKNNASQLDFVLGDFNAVPWDQYIKDLSKENVLQDSRVGYQGTYPSKLPFSLPIDYIFYKKEAWNCINFEVLGANSSDHLGIKGGYKKTPS